MNYLYTIIIITIIFFTLLVLYNFLIIRFLKSKKSKVIVNKVYESKIINDLTNNNLCNSKLNNDLTGNIDNNYLPNNMNNNYLSDNMNNNYLPEIIISLTTSPKRLPKIKPVIDSIMNQTLLPNKIVLNLPYVFKRFNTTFDCIPTFILDNSKIIVNRCEDIGPITKILPTIPLARDMDSIIISIDDDIIYSNNLIELLVNKSLLNPECVITGSGVGSYRNNLYELAEGYTGILYRKKFLIDFSLDEIKNFNRACYLGDDLIISNFLAKKNIPIMAIFDIRDDIVFNNRILSYANDYDALHLSHENNTFHGHDYKSCIDYLKNNNNYYLKNFENYLHN